MNDQPLMPMSGDGFGGKPRTNLLPIVLIVMLALGTLLFGTLAISYHGKAQTATSTLTSQKAAAAAAAKQQQKAADDAAYTIAGETPFRSYTAPVQYGSFEIKFPKNWSSSVDHESSGTQVNLVLNPDFILRTNSVDALMAARITLQQQTSSQFMQSFASDVKTGRLKQVGITVSDQAGYDITGNFTNKRTTREVVIPVRDKVLVFINENSKYAPEFNQILAQAKIVP